MYSAIGHSVIDRDIKQLEKAIGSIRGKTNWSLVTYIDELAPYMVMECNLKYKNFHQIKQALFLHKISGKDYFNNDTEWEILRLISHEMAKKPWIGILALTTPTPHREKATMDDIFAETERQNAHNAFYYALGGLSKNHPKTLITTLLRLGAIYVSRTLGHSLSCFFPVAEDMFYVSHPFSSTALLSYILYLCRYGPGKKDNRTQSQIHGPVSGRKIFFRRNEKIRMERYDLCMM